MLIEIPKSYRVLEAAVAARDARYPRPPGLHVSTIIEDALAKIYPVKDRDIGPMEAFWGFGLAWEEFVGGGLRKLWPAVRRGRPLTKDGVIVTPDFVNRLNRRPHETKFTWTSSSEGVEAPKVLRYVWQLDAYMHVLGVTTGYLHIGYVRGNYRDRVVEFQSYERRRTEQELRRHWRKLLQHADDEQMERAA